MIDLIWKHQKETYGKMTTQLEKTGRAAYIYPTGGGKSFPSLKEIEDLLLEKQESRILFLAPLVAILNQTRDYIKDYIIANSDLKEEKIFSQNIVFSTYHNLNNRYLELTKYDLIIADEFHCVGAEKWGVSFDNLLRNNPNAKLIAMTATPERTDRKNMIDIYFSDEEQIYNLSLAEALSGDKTGEVIFNPSRYIRVLSQLKPVLEQYREKLDCIEDGKQKEELRKRFEKLENAISVADDLKTTFTKSMTKKNGKYIIFCKDEADMKEAMEKAPDWFEGVNKDILIDYVFSGSSGNKLLNLRKTEKQNELSLERFKNPHDEDCDKLKLLFCVDKLNAGIHIPGISGAIMLRPTESPIVYKQQLGRILSSDPNAEETVMIDVANNWLRFKDFYDEYVQTIYRGNDKDKDKGKRICKKTNYESYKYTDDELDLLDLMREIDEKINEKGHKGITQLLEICKVLKQKGIDLKKIQLSERRGNTMYNFSLSELKIENISDIISENKFDGKFSFGLYMKTLRMANNGTKPDIRVTETQLEEAKRLGIIDNIYEETICNLETLKENGVFLNKGLSKRLPDGTRYFYKLYEIKQDGIDIEKIIKENNLDREFELGSGIASLRSAYRNNSKNLTQSQIERIEKLGIVELRQHPYLQKLIEIQEWKEKYGELPRRKRNPKNEKEENENLLAIKLQNTKKYVKEKEENIDLTEEEREIISQAYNLGIMDKKKHTYLILLDKVQDWKEKNHTLEKPKARDIERKKPAEERSEEYFLAKGIERLQNAFLKKYQDISDEEFLELDDEIQEVIIRSADMGIGLKFDLLKRMKGCIAKCVEFNSEVRFELDQKVKEYLEEQNKGEIDND